MDRVDAAKTFCVVAETLQFRAAAKRLGLSPQVVTRTVNALESQFGEPLFHRSTRSVRLSVFGEAFLPEARRFVADADRLFAGSQQSADEEIAGPVRVTTPDFPIMQTALEDVLDGLREHPRVTLDWRATVDRLDIVDDQVDVGVRVGHPTSDGLIVRPVGRTWDRVVAAPALLARLNLPADIRELRRGFPLCVVRNGRTGKPWPWYLRPDLHFEPEAPRMVADGAVGQLRTTLAGAALSAMQDVVCRPFVERGELVELFSDLERVTWPIYVFRAQQSVTPPRVKKVFSLLVESLQRRLPKENR